MGIVTVAQADRHLRWDLETDGNSPPAYVDDRLPDLELKIAAAEAIVLDYLKVSGDPFEGSPPAWSVGSPPLFTSRDVKVIQAAVLLVLSALVDDAPERTIADYMKPGGTIDLLLVRLRDPALA